MRVTSRRSIVIMGLLLEEYGSYSAIRKASKIDLEGIMTTPKLSDENVKRLHDWSIRNYHALEPREKRMYAYRKNHPTFLDKIAKTLHETFSKLIQRKSNA